PATTAARSGTPSRASAGSRWTIPRPNGTSWKGWSGSASPRPMCGSSRLTSPGTRWPTGCAPPGSRPACPACSCSKGSPSTWSQPSSRPCSNSSVRSPPSAAAWPSACPCRGSTTRVPGREETAAKRERLRSAGLLTASAGPRAPQASAPSGPLKVSEPSTSPVPSAPRLGTLSVSALLSQALVAFTIEFDNEAEHRLPHRTTDHGASGHGDGAWLVSLVMWENCLRHLTDQPITVGELEARARTGTNLDGMRRWGYITIDGTARKIHKGRPGPDAVLRATAAGLRARQVWLPLPGLIEQRWRERFGAGQVDRLRESLVTLASRLDPGLPDCLPILGAALLSRGPAPALPPAGHVDLAGLPLSALLSRVLLSFALEYE